VEGRSAAVTAEVVPANGGWLWVVTGGAVDDVVGTTVVGAPVDAGARARPAACAGLSTDVLPQAAVPAVRTMRRTTDTMTEPEETGRREGDTADDATGARRGPGAAPAARPRTSRDWPSGVGAGAVLAAVGLVAGVLSVGTPLPAQRVVVAVRTPITVVTTSTTTTTTTTTTTPPSTTTVTAAPPTTAPAPPADPIAGLPGVGSSGQVLTVTTAGYGTDAATVTAYQRDGGRFVRVLGPWASFVGVGGLAPPGAKREGDGRTPSGTYGFLPFFFGIDPAPAGIRYPYRPVTSDDYWDDDPTSPAYNQWVVSAAAAGAGPEHLADHVPAYDEAAVIAYNTDPVVADPAMGSAIFLHVADGGGTAGCVSIPAGGLVAVLQWLDPARAPRIAIGTASSLGLR
jgi:L,D-peptidoglycan transpeptidase YkuD (ErfK/YbiS/YcfS/YnhG family)